MLHVRQGLLSYLVIPAADAADKEAAEGGSGGGGGGGGGGSGGGARWLPGNGGVGVGGVQPNKSGASVLLPALFQRGHLHHLLEVGHASRAIVRPS